MTPEWRAQLETPEWSFPTVMARLGIPWHQTPFPPGVLCDPSDLERVLSGELSGEASVFGIWISPIADCPIRSAVHELAHVLLQHIHLPISRLPPAVAQTLCATGEVEAETVALAVLTALNRPEAELAESYEYLNTWLPRRGLHHLNTPETLDLAAQVILKYGRPESAADTAPVAVQLDKTNSFDNIVVHGRCPT